eukprot:3462573-Rhodomonas_salina.3
MTPDHHTVPASTALVFENHPAVDEPQAVGEGNAVANPVTGQQSTGGEAEEQKLFGKPVLIRLDLA